MSVRLGTETSFQDQLARFRHWPDRRPEWRRWRWSRPSPRSTIILERLGQPGFDLIDTCQIGRMSGKKFRYRLLRPETELPDHLSRTTAHALPKWDRCTRILPGLRHQSKSAVISFRLLLPIERQPHTDSIGPQQALDRTGIDLSGCCRAQCAQLRNLGQDTPAHPLHPMAL